MRFTTENQKDEGNFFYGKFGPLHPTWKGGRPDCTNCGKKRITYGKKLCFQCAVTRKRRPLTKAQKKHLSEYNRRLGKKPPSPLGKKYSEEHKRKIAISRTGMKHSEETKIKLSLQRIGSKSATWRGGISFLPYPPEWRDSLKNKIRERDKYICQICFGYGKIIHHIDYEKKNCVPENLITLCNSCHGKTNFNREKWKEYFMNKRDFIYTNS